MFHALRVAFCFKKTNKLITFFVYVLVCLVVSGMMHSFFWFEWYRTLKCILIRCFFVSYLSYIKCTSYSISCVSASTLDSLRFLYLFCISQRWCTTQQCNWINRDVTRRQISCTFHTYRRTQTFRCVRLSNAFSTSIIILTESILY